MKVTKEDNATREVVISVEMDPEDVEPFLDRAYKRMVNNVQISGFRPGKAPRAIVEGMMGKEALIREAVDFMVPETLERVLEEEEVQGFGQPDVELVGLEPPSFKAVVTLEPLVELGDYQSLRLEAEEVKVTEEEVAEALESIRYDSTPWEPADRTAQFGDLLTIDVNGVVDGRQVLNDKGVSYLPAKDNALPLPGFSVYLEGMAKDESKEFTLPVPQENADVSIAGKECRFTVGLLEIREKRLPSLDDEFAKGVGDGYESLEELNKSVRERLTSHAESMAQRRYQEKGLAEVVKGASVEVSPRVIEREVDHLLEQRARGQGSHQGSMEEYLQNVGKSMEEIKEELRPTAVERLTEDLVVRKLVEEEGIEVSSEELEAEIKSMVTGGQDSSEDSLRRALSSEELRRAVSNGMVRRKTLERLADIVGGAEQAEDESSKGEVKSQKTGEGGGLSGDEPS